MTIFFDNTKYPKVDNTREIKEIEHSDWWYQCIANDMKRDNGYYYNQTDDEAEQHYKRLDRNRD